MTAPRTERRRPLEAAGTEVHPAHPLWGQGLQLPQAPLIAHVPDNARSSHTSPYRSRSSSGRTGPDGPGCWGELASTHAEISHTVLDAVPQRRHVRYRGCHLGDTVTTRAKCSGTEGWRRCLRLQALLTRHHVLANRRDADQVGDRVPGSRQHPTRVLTTRGPRHAPMIGRTLSTHGYSGTPGRPFQRRRHDRLHHTHA